MIRKTYIFFILLFLTACNAGEQSKIDQEPQVVTRDGEPAIYTIERSNNEMNKAIEKARNSLSFFKAAILNPKNTYNNFSLKVKFVENGETEHIWLSEVIYSKGNYSGIVNNDPEYISRIKYGDVIKIDPTTISDWMYLEGDVMRGGFTTRVLFRTMSKKEKEEFLLTNGIIIDEKEI